MKGKSIIERIAERKIRFNNKIYKKMLSGEDEGGVLKVDTFKSFYAVIDRGDGKRCAWCDKLLSELKDVDSHITNEDTLAKVEKTYEDSGSEELLYKDFMKLKEEILNG